MNWMIFDWKVEEQTPSLIIAALQSKSVEQETKLRDCPVSQVERKHNKNDENRRKNDIL